MNGCSRDQRVGRTGRQTEGAEGAKEVGEELRFSGGRKKGAAGEVRVSQIRTFLFIFYQLG